MMFCPKCKSLLLPKKQGSKKILACSCGFTSNNTDNVSVKEKFEKQKDIEVIEKRIEVLPKVDYICPKCKHKEAYWWEQQIRAADEPATRFFKCCSCEHVWRDLKSG